jgi:hypothetical protein
MHSLPKGYTRSRHFGGYHGRKRAAYLASCRALLAKSLPAGANSVTEPSAPPSKNHHRWRVHAVTCRCDALTNNGDRAGSSSSIAASTMTPRSTRGPTTFTHAARRGFRSMNETQETSPLTRERGPQRMSPLEIVVPTHESAPVRTACVPTARIRLAAPRMDHRRLASAAKLSPLIGMT